MSGQRYTPELKDEAVKQVLDRGYSVAEVFERLGVTPHSLYKWMNVVKPENSALQATELLEEKREILKLKSDLKRTEIERDILKKAAVDSFVIIVMNFIFKPCVVFLEYITAAFMRGWINHYPITLLKISDC